MKVTIDRGLCQGHGRCYALAPAVFTCDDEGDGEVIGDGVVPPADEPAARLAADSCPEYAIGVTDT